MSHQQILCFILPWLRETDKLKSKYEQWSFVKFNVKYIKHLLIILVILISLFIQGVSRICCLVNRILKSW